MKLSGIIKRFFPLLLLAVVTALSLSASPGELILATTTSTQDSGLLDELIPLFEKKTGYFVKTIAVGSGQAMAMGKRGEADVLLVHSPSQEKEFIAGGWGVNRRLVMHNDFIIIGPEDDPAGIRKCRNVIDAMRRISGTGSLFISRGDNSGTHTRERDLWKKAAINPLGSPWYQETGLGMGQTINVASEKKCYTLADRGTYLALKKNVPLVILFEGDAAMKNIYHVIQVNGKRWKKVNTAAARAFSDFMVSRETQEIIRRFGVGKYGSPLFFPDAGQDQK